MKACIRKIFPDGREGVASDAMICSGQSLLAIVNTANERFPCDHWKAEVYYNPDKIYGKPNKVIRINRGEKF